MSISKSHVTTGATTHVQAGIVGDLANIVQSCTNSTQKDELIFEPSERIQHGITDVTQKVMRTKLNVTPSDGYL